jgi:hypothetical protein
MPGARVAHARLLVGAVEAPVAVPLVDHVVVLGVEPAGQLGRAAEDVDRLVVVPAVVDVAGAPLVAPHVAELRVEHRLPALAVAPLEVPRRPRERAVADAAQVRGPLPPGEVLVPGVEVGGGVPGAAAHRVVLDRARGVEPLGELLHAGDLGLRLGAVDLLAVGALGAQPPRLVERDPREDARVVVVARDHPAHRRLVLAERQRVGRAPPVGHVGHDEHAQPVGPVELAGRLDLDVLAEPVEPDLACAEDLVAQHAVGREGVVAGRVVRLVEGELEVHGRPLSATYGAPPGPRATPTDRMPKYVSTRSSARPGAPSVAVASYRYGSSSRQRRALGTGP